MSASKKVAQEIDPVTEAAQAAVKRAGNDAQKATRLLAEKVRKDDALRHALTEPLIDGACYDAIRAVFRKNRAQIWTAPNYSTNSGGDRVVQLARGNAETLLDFPLPGGKRLADATREDIAAAADFYEKQSSDMAFKARWLRSVAQSLTDDKTAGEVLTDARLRDLQEAARNG